MVISDFILVAIDQRIPLKPNIPNLEVCISNRNPFFVPKQYEHGLFILQALRGISYTFYPPKEQIYSNAFCELVFSDQPEIKIVHVRECWTEIICDIIAYYVYNSPHRLIGLLFRLDTPYSEIVHATCGLSEFLSNLRNNRIHFDELYFVAE